MISLALGLAVLTTGFQTAQAAPAETVSVKRVFAEKETGAYVIGIKLEAGQTIEISSDVMYKVSKLMPDNKAKLDFSVDHFSSGLGDAPGDFSCVFDATGMGDNLTQGNNEIVYALFEVMSIVPGKELKVGDEFSRDYKFVEGTMSVKGKLKEVRTEDGNRVAAFEYTCTVQPPQGAEATVKIKNLVNVADGKVLKSDGTFEQGEATGTMTMKPKPKSL